MDTSDDAVSLLHALCARNFVTHACRPTGSESPLQPTLERPLPKGISQVDMPREEKPAILRTMKHAVRTTEFGDGGRHRTRVSLWVSQEQ